MLKPVNRHRNATMTAHSATFGSASGATVRVSIPSAPPRVGTIPKNGANRNFQTVPTATGASTKGAKNTNTNTVRPRRTSATSTASSRPEPRLEHDRRAGEQHRVQQAPMEHGVAEDRACVVVEARRGP